MYYSYFVYCVKIKTMEEHKNYPTLSYFIGVASAVCGFDITTDTRHREYVFGRTLYYGICRKYTNYGYTAIGRAVGRNHATVLHSLKNLERDVINNTDCMFAEKWTRATQIVEDIFTNKSTMRKYDMKIQLSLLSKQNETLISQLNSLRDEMNNMLSNDEKKLLELYKMLSEEDKMFLIMKAEVTLKMKEDEKRRIEERNASRLNSKFSIEQVQA